MKTTVDIAEPLLRRAKEAAGRDGTTLRALVEEGLRKILERRDAPEFVLRDASFEGEGLNPAVGEESWERIREMIYRGRGG